MFNKHKLSKSFLIEWNNTFPLDRQFRKKYNIAFNSEAHRKTNQIDIYLEMMEDKLFDDFEKEIEENIRKKKLYEKGEWISVSERTIEIEDDLFDKINI